MALLALSATAAPREPLGDWSSVSRLAPGAEVRISLADGKTLRGSLEAATSESLTVNLSTGQEVRQRQEIRRVQTRRQGHRLRNTLVGLGVGAGAGLAVGAAVDHQHKGEWLYFSLGKAVFTPSGAIIGTVVGLVLPTGGWRDVYRAP